MMNFNVQICIEIISLADINRIIVMVIKHFMHKTNEFGFDIDDQSCISLVLGEKSYITQMKKSENYLLFLNHFLLLNLNNVKKIENFSKNLIFLFFIMYYLTFIWFFDNVLFPGSFF